MKNLLAWVALLAAAATAARHLADFLREYDLVPTLVAGFLVFAFLLNFVVAKPEKAKKPGKKTRKRKPALQPTNQQSLNA